MEIYATHRPEILTVDTTFSIGSGMTTDPIITGKYNVLTFIAFANSGSATLNLRTSPTSNFTIAQTQQLNLAAGITKVFSSGVLTGLFADITISNITSNTVVKVHGFGTQM